MGAGPMATHTAHTFNQVHAAHVLEQEAVGGEHGALGRPLPRHSEPQPLRDAAGEHRAAVGKPLVYLEHLTHGRVLFLRLEGGSAEAIKSQRVWGRGDPCTHSTCDWPFQTMAQLSTMGLPRWAHGPPLTSDTPQLLNRPHTSAPFAG